MSTSITYLLLFPVIYTILNVSIPGIPNALSNREHQFFEMNVAFVPSVVKIAVRSLKTYMSIDVWLIFRVAYQNVCYMGNKASTILHNHRVALLILAALQGDDETGKLSFSKNPMLSESERESSATLQPEHKSKPSLEELSPSKPINMKEVFSDNLSDVEKQIYQQSNLNNNPNYYALSLWVYEDLVTTLNVDKKNKLIQPLLLLLSLSIFGHMLSSIGRNSWMIIVKKLYLFIHVSLGIWTDMVFDCFRTDQTINDLTKALRPRTEEIGHVLDATLSIRSIFFQLFPTLTILSVFVQVSSSSPVFVYSPKLLPLLPPLYMTRKEAFDAAVEQDIVPQQWSLGILMIHKLICGGRIAQYVIGVTKVIIAMSIIFASNNQISGTIVLDLQIIIIGLVVLPFYFFYSLKFVVLVGHSPLFRLKDSDFNDFVYIYNSCRSSADDKDIDNDDNSIISNININRIDDVLMSNRIDENLSIELPLRRT